MAYNWVNDLKWIRKHLRGGKIISKRTKDGLLIEFTGGNVSAKPPQWFKEWSDKEFKPLKEDVALIKSCPTIQRELGLKRQPNQRFTNSKRAR